MHASNSILYSIPVNLICCMYIFLVFPTYQLTFMSIVFCAFPHWNKQSNWTGGIIFNQKCRRRHTKKQNNWTRGRSINQQCRRRHTKVEGVLVVENPYSAPFEPVCSRCNSPASASAFINDGTIVCLCYSHKWSYIYRHCLNAIIRTLNNTIVHCTIRKPVLQDVLPHLTELPYEIYLQKKANIVYMLCDFRVDSKFTLNEDSVILHIV